MRISGGAHRSRVLVSPRGERTRPTSDRVREALFSILEARGIVAGARVVDLYAGTGALGLEALSRGATFATFVESDRRALEALERNIDALRERHRARVVPLDVQRALVTLGKDGASLVFCDPPYAAVGGVAKLLEAIVRQGVTSPDATIVLEHASRDKPAVDAMLDAQPHRRGRESRTYGDTTLTFFLAFSAAS